MNGRTGINTDARQVAAGASQALNEASCDGIAGQGNERDLVRLRLEKRRAGGNRIDDVRITADDFRDHRREPRSVSFPPVAFDYKVLPLDVSEAPELGE